MASNYWIKFYHEILDDPKMGRLPDNLWRRFYECCLMAGELQQDGRIPAIQDIAWRLRIEEETLRTEFDQMARIGLLDFVADPLDEHWIVMNFANRQSPMSGAERVKRHRETQKKQHYYGSCNDNVTIRYTEKETEEEEDIEKETEEETDAAAIFSHYQNNIAMLTPSISETIAASFDDYPSDWFVDAIDIAVERNVRNWRYIEGILKNWKTKGKDNGRSKSNQSDGGGAVKL